QATRPTDARPVTTRPASRPAPSPEAVSRIRQINTEIMPALRKLFARVRNPANRGLISETIDGRKFSFHLSKPDKRASAITYVQNEIGLMNLELLSIQEGTWEPPILQKEQSARRA